MDDGAAGLAANASFESLARRVSVLALALFLFRVKDMHGQHESDPGCTYLQRYIGSMGVDDALIYCRNAMGVCSGSTGVKGGHRAR